MYRGVFTVGVVVTNAVQNSRLISANPLTDYSYISAKTGDRNGDWLARCLTGLGPSGNNNNTVLGGLYFNGNKISYGGEQGPCASDVVQVRSGGGLAGVINMRQCGTFTIADEGQFNDDPVS